MQVFGLIFRKKYDCQKLAEITASRSAAFVMPMNGEVRGITENFFTKTFCISIISSYLCRRRNIVGSGLLRQLIEKNERRYVLSCWMKSGKFQKCIQGGIVILHAQRGLLALYLYTQVYQSLIQEM